MVGLTGGIASGKSTIAKMFRELGVDVIDADQVSRDVCLPGKPAMEKIRAQFGNVVLDDEGGLDRAAIRKVVFNNREKLLLLESIVHPEIYKEIGNWLFQCKENGASAAIIEATLLIEAPPPMPMDKLIVVTCPEDIRITRARDRDGFDEAHIRQVMANQLPDEERAKHADYLIKNDGDYNSALKQVRNIYKQLTQS